MPIQKWAPATLNARITAVGRCGPDFRELRVLLEERLSDR